MPDTAILQGEILHTQHTSKICMFNQDIKFSRVSKNENILEKIRKTEFKTTLNNLYKLINTIS